MEEEEEGGREGGTYEQWIDKRNEEREMVCRKKQDDISYSVCK